MIPYICYNDLEEFYTLKSVCNLLKMDKETLKQSCKRYDIIPAKPCASRSELRGSLPDLTQPLLVPPIVKIWLPSSELP